MMSSVENTFSFAGTRTYGENSWFSKMKKKKKTKLKMYSVGFIMQHTRVCKSKEYL